jgi:hypothetical protein
MKYMLLIHHDEQLWSDRTELEKQEIYKEYRQLIEELQEKRIYLVGDQLQPSTAGQTVRVRDGQSMITDGPFAETREQLGGFFFIEAANDDEAKSIAARIPSARTGAIEVRPVVATNGAKPA